MLVPSSAPAASTTGSKTPQPLLPTGTLVPFLLITGLFFLWGVPNNLNDVLIRQFMKSFAISRFQAGLVQSAFYLGYFIFAVPAALLMRKLGYKAGFITGLFLFGTGAFLFWPAALIGRYSFFLFALFVVASGLSFLETAANPFVAQLGPPESSERRLNLAQAFNPLGAVSGVLIGTIFIFSGIELTPHQIASMQAVHQYHAYLRLEILRTVKPYLVLGGIAWFWAFLIARARLPSLQADTSSPGHSENPKQLLKYPHFILAVIAQFLYVGAQVGTWSYFIQYIQSYTHQPEKSAGYILTGTLVAFGIGRFSSTYFMRFFPPNKLMGVYGILNIVLVGIGICMPGWAGLWAIFTTSFFMSVMYPTIFALGIKQLGNNSKIAASIIVMSIVGGAVLTPIMGLISQKQNSIAIAYVVPFVAYIFIAYYSFYGSHVRIVRELPLPV
ncbi:MAG TPA: L-fucose:H+ symporter permease [Acidobacteriaceae bacterium]|jgi:FHS family L-fucose permease-like MFS transporter|nr:L-fucose:H+ symporter permease [Acidobacteriaceae bacterium]